MARLSVEITIGTWRKDTTWKRKKIDWEDFCERLSKTTRTPETYKQYLSYPKDQQDEIKDKGGFVGGLIHGGHRKKDAVINRTMLTFDLDKMTIEQGLRLWRRFCFMYDCAALLYSTHKHSVETPRFRIIMPLASPVTVEQYQAIMRMVASHIGIDQCDPTTFQPERMMYWPSTSADGVYVFERQDGVFLDPQDVLGEYVGGPDAWRDTSQWPVCERETRAVKKSAAVQGNPLSKHGSVGTFCRAYTIDSAIEQFLGGVYAPAGEGRYTYLKGSTAAGLVVYPDEHGNACFAFSHHGTDPCSGRLVNAFDLVRLHKFGEMDDKYDPDLPVIGAPSFKEMMEYLRRDPGYIQQAAQERMDKAQNAFKDFDIAKEWEQGDEGQKTPEDAAAEAAEISMSEKAAVDYQDAVQALDRQQEEAETEGEEDNTWLQGMDMTAKGQIAATIHNVLLVLGNDPGFKGRLVYDSFRQRKLILGKLPWRRVRFWDQYWKDSDEAALRYYMEKTFNISGVQKVRDAIDTHMTQHQLHPVKKYLKGLKWDGVERIDTMLIEYMGCADTKYVRTITRKCLLGAVARIMRPGCKFDNVVVLVGEEGKMKSMLWNKLAGNWFSDSLTGVTGKDAYEQIQGSWIIEIAELQALNKAEQNSIKNFISKQIDNYRAAYGRNLEIHPRQCIFVGTTNMWDFLKGLGGDRRFWPAVIGVTDPRKNVAGMDAEVIGQLWAEAMEAFRAGEQLHLSEEMFQQARAQQKLHTVQDERAELVKKYLDMEVPVNWYEMDALGRKLWLAGAITGQAREKRELMTRDRISVAEIWSECFEQEIGKLDKRQSESIGQLMNQMPGWVRPNSPIKIKGLVGVVRGWYRELNVSGERSNLSRWE